MQRLDRVRLDLIQEIIHNPVPLDMNILGALKRAPGPRSLPVAGLPDILRNSPLGSRFRWRRAALRGPFIDPSHG